MKKAIKLKMTSELSKKTIEYLQNKESMDINAIAKLIGSTPSYVRQVQDGQKIFSSKHLNKLEKERPNIYLAMLPSVIGEKLEGSFDYLKEQGMKLKTSKGLVKQKSKKSLKMAKGISSKVALAVCKLLTKDNDH